MFIKCPYLIIFKGIRKHTKLKLITITKMQQNPSYFHPEINRMLQKFTKYVSKPLGFNKMYKEVNKRGNLFDLHF